MADETTPAEDRDATETTSAAVEAQQDSVDGTEEANGAASTDASESAASESVAEPPRELSLDEVQVPEFAHLREGGGRTGNTALDRFYDVHVPISAELGRVELPLGELVRLTEGAVLRLERPVSEPVDLVSQGVRLARGEVIVIDDCFAIRIKEIVASK